jgi:fatty acid-binding protein DegV
MSIALSAESTIDLPKELLQKFDIVTVPFTLTMGEKTGLDGEVTADELFAFTDKTGKLADQRGQPVPIRGTLPQTCLKTTIL